MLIDGLILANKRVLACVSRRIAIPIARRIRRPVDRDELAKRPED